MNSDPGENICPRCKEDYDKTDDSGKVEAQYGTTEVSWHVCPSCYEDVLGAVIHNPYQ